MFCFSVKKQLIPYMEKTLDRKRAESIARHLAKCAKCREELELIKRASGAFRSAKTPVQEPAADLWSRIEREIAPVSAPVARNYPIRALQLGGAALAAAVILFAAVNIGRVGEKPVSTKPGRNVVAVKPHTESPNELPFLKKDSHTATDAKERRVEHGTSGVKEPAKQVEQLKRTVSQPDTTVVASLPRDTDNILASPESVRSTSDGGSAFDRLDESVKSRSDSSVGALAPSAVNSESNTAQNIGSSNSFSEGRASGSVQNSANVPNVAKVSEYPAEVAAAPLQQNNLNSAWLGNTTQNQKSLERSAKESKQSPSFTRITQNNSSNVVDQNRISSILPADYAEHSVRYTATTTVHDQRLAVVCGSPRPGSELRYAKVFVVTLRGSWYSLIASDECTGDVSCESINLYPDKADVVISIAAYSQSGSAKNNHLRIYRYNINSHQLQRQAVVEYINGRVLNLPGRSGNPPAFLVAEPLYGSAGRFIFSLYGADSSGSYKLLHTLSSNNKHDDLRSAYSEVREQLLKTANSAFIIPENF